MQNLSTNVVNGFVDDKNQKMLEVLMFPWLAHGHISPFLELAKKLAKSTEFIVYLCSTPVNLISPWAALAAMENHIPVVDFITCSTTMTCFCDHLFENPHGKVGPLVQEPNQEDENSDIIITWLDKKSEISTVFVSFGSEYFLTDEEREAIAHGLELTNVNFVWVVRFPKDTKGEGIKLEDSLPKVFLTRVSDRGLVVEGWAPQTKTLEHHSIGGFESLWVEIHNGKLIEEIGVGIEVIRSDDGRLIKETIADVIDKVLIKEEGRFVREKAKIMSEKIALNGDEEMDVIVKELVKLCFMWKISSFTY
ncbi:hypothetical protein Leryth_017274 [Lithospermum erythrorhizon]|nr:hypothetical protein Leryth_017274 [Lithospermum erythrorhizon]